MTTDDILEIVRQLDDDDLILVADLVRTLEEGRRVVDIVGNPVETASRNPQPEKR